MHSQKAYRVWYARDARCQKWGPNDSRITTLVYLLRISSRACAASNSQQLPRPTRQDVHSATHQAIRPALDAVPSAVVAAYMEGTVGILRLAYRVAFLLTSTDRFILNYKAIPYTTEFIGFPDIAAVLSTAGAPPTRTSDPKYSVPAIIDGDTVLSDSAVIADYLEKTHPEPTIYPHGREAQMRWADAIMESLSPLVPIVVPATTRILPEADADYFVKTRKLIFGGCLLQYRSPSAPDRVCRCGGEGYAC